MAAQPYESTLIEGANALINYDHTTITISSIEDYRKHHEYRTTIFNKHSKNARSVSIAYNEFSKIVRAKTIVRDANDEVIEKYTLNDMQDWSVGNDVASDNRVKYIEIRYNHYPYSIEVEYETIHRGSLHYPKWYVQPISNLAVAEASLSVISPKEQLRYEFRDIDTFDSLIVDGKIFYKWEVHNRKAFDYEPYSEGLDGYSPYVFLAPVNFIIDGISGNMNSWKNFGDFINKLNHGKNTLSDEQRTEIRTLVSPDMTILEKTQIIYSYLQKNTRYVSIQLGIGGWSPIDAGFVHEKKYGDCKALSFYTKSALEEVGVNCYYTLITARPYSPVMKEDFPNAHFNHAILTVPIEQDTVWLECTSQTTPFGYMGYHTGNRKALLINEKGGQVINTKYYSPEENLQTTYSTFSITDEGFMQGRIQRTFNGLEIENDDFHRLYLSNQKEQKEWFFDNLPLENFNIINFSVDSMSQEVVPKTGFTIELDVHNAIRKTGNRYFLSFTPLTDISYINTASGNRTKDLIIRYGYSQEDSILYNLNFPGVIETGIETVNLETIFGQYSKQIIHNGNTIKCYRYFKLNDGYYTRSQYEDFVKFIKQVKKADRKRIVVYLKT